MSGSIRDACIASYKSAMRRGGRNALVTLNPSSEVGAMLAHYDGDAHVALARVVVYSGRADDAEEAVYWMAVATELRALIAEEAAPRKAMGGERC